MSELTREKDLPINFFGRYVITTSNPQPENVVAYYSEKSEEHEVFVARHMFLVDFFGNYWIWHSRYENQFIVFEGLTYLLTKKALPYSEMGYGFFLQVV